MTELPRDVEVALHKAKRLEWMSIGWLAITITIVMIVMGSSQAMKAAWIEDMLSFLPPIAFLLAIHQARKKPDSEHRYGRHRWIGAAHLSASIALLGMGGYLLIDSTMTLINQEHPTIGMMKVLGFDIWLGWLMIAAMIVTSIPTVILGRMKLKLAPKLHDKVLYADADMNKADWQTAVATCLGILGIAFGLWWADSAVAILVSASIIHDGWSNVSNAVSGLLDRQARTHDDAEDHPTLAQIPPLLADRPWAKDTWIRMRDEGHVFHTEVFVKTDEAVPVEELQLIRDRVRALDWKLRDSVVIPVAAFPHDEPER